MESQFLSKPLTVMLSRSIIKYTFEDAQRLLPFLVIIYIDIMGIVTLVNMLFIRVV